MKVLTFSVQILTLHFVVLSFDRYSRDDVVGEVRNDRDKTYYKILHTGEHLTSQCVGIIQGDFFDWSYLKS